MRKVRILRIPTIISANFYEGQKRTMLEREGTKKDASKNGSMYQNGLNFRPNWYMVIKGSVFKSRLFRSEVGEEMLKLVEVLYEDVSTHRAFVGSDDSGCFELVRQFASAVITDFEHTL